MILRWIAAGALALSAAVATPAGASHGPFAGELEIKELGVRAGLRLRLYHDPGFLNVPETAGHLFLVAADSARGENAFFIPTDIALELGSRQLYRVEFEQASDLFGQALGGLLRAGETHLGFLILPGELDLDAYLPDHPDSVVVRYAHHRTSLHPASPEETAWWSDAVARPRLAAALNAWWEWIQLIASAPEMTEGERRFLAERVFPGQGHLLAEEGMSAEGLRNAILRVGERRLLESRTIQRVAPRYPAAARQIGAHGLVVVLAYITDEGRVADGQILASNTVHLLNMSALVASRDWRFSRARDEAGEPVDGWRLLPFQFRLGEGQAAASADTAGVFHPPTIAKRGTLDYPFEAKRQRIKGTVVYRVMVDETGKLAKVVLEQGVHPIVDQAALAAVERTLFLPATRGGDPVPGEILMSFEFQEELD